jgi:hypothetical protein
MNDLDLLVMARLHAAHNGRGEQERFEDALGEAMQHGLAGAKRADPTKGDVLSYVADRMTSAKRAVMKEARKAQAQGPIPETEDGEIPGLEGEIDPAFEDDVPSSSTLEEYIDRLHLTQTTATGEVILHFETLMAVVEAIVALDGWFNQNAPEPAWIDARPFVPQSRRVALFGEPTFFNIWEIPDARMGAHELYWQFRAHTIPSVADSEIPDHPEPIWDKPDTRRTLPGQPFTIYAEDSDNLAVSQGTVFTDPYLKERRSGWMDEEGNGPQTNVDPDTIPGRVYAREVLVRRYQVSGIGLNLVTANPRLVALYEAANERMPYPLPHFEISPFMELKVKHIVHEESMEAVDPRKPFRPSGSKVRIGRYGGLYIQLKPISDQLDYEKAYPRLVWEWDHAEGDDLDVQTARNRKDDPELLLSEAREHAIRASFPFVKVPTQREMERELTAWFQTLPKPQRYARKSREAYIRARLAGIGRPEAQKLAWQINRKTVVSLRPKGAITAAGALVPFQHLEGKGYQFDIPESQVCALIRTHLKAVPAAQELANRLENQEVSHAS